MTRTARGVQLLVAASAAVVVPLCWSGAVPETPADLHARVALSLKGASFSEALAALRKQSGVCVLAEGSPRRGAADLEMAGTAEQALDAIAGAFDYTWSITKSGVVLMRKRFQDPDERPELGRLEMLETARRVLAAFRGVAFDPDEPAWTRMLKRLAASLTDAQRQSLDGGARLRVADLSPEQVALLEAAVLNHRFATPRVQWEVLAIALERLPRSRLSVAHAGSGGPPQLPPRASLVLEVQGATGRASVIDLGVFPVGAGEEGSR